MKRSAVVLLAVLALPAQFARAGIFDDKEARASIDKLRADVDSVGARVDRLAQNQIDFANQMEMLKGDLARLRGQVEVLTNDLDTAQKRQRDFYIDLDSRLRKLETAATAAPAADAKPAADAAPKVDPVQEQRQYESALGLFKAAKYRDAGVAFAAFIKMYPSSSLLPNAHYWMASSYYQMKEYDRAADGFGKVATTWPNDAKAPDALLAKSNALTEAGDAKGSKKTLEALLAQYPGSPAAQAAKQRLKKK
ncbi:MAG TPA: tol-pal system protein YbgF [Rhodocyclaceae bacterium]|nr:tol-pal system protein YbgF [Rhodocyclaceae bacterium]